MALWNQGKSFLDKMKYDSLCPFVILMTKYLFKTSNKSIRTASLNILLVPWFLTLGRYMLLNMLSFCKRWVGFYSQSNYLYWMNLMKVRAIIYKLWRAMSLDCNSLSLLVPEGVARSCSVKRVFLEISQNSQESTCARVSFLIKLQATLFYRTLPGDCFWNALIRK